MFELFIKDDIWQYLSSTQKDLLKEGHYLMQVTETHRFRDYSFLVFPFAKSYEGYLKQLFLDAGFITHLEYISNHFRVGKYLSPHMIHRLKDRSVYAQIRERSTEDMAREMWQMWTEGRNKVFHYYPHNLRRLSYDDARELNEQFLHVMQKAFRKLRSSSKKLQKENGIAQGSAIA